MFRPDPEHNPTKLRPRGVKVWFCDPYCSSQKPHTPYDVFVEKHGAEGKAFLDALGIVRIPANQVTLHPFLLGQKYQRAADRAILKKNGITAKKPETNK